MIQQKGKAQKYYFEYTLAGAAATGLTPTFYVYRNGTLFSPTNTPTNGEVGHGYYWYLLPYQNVTEQDANDDYLVVAEVGEGLADKLIQASYFLCPQWVTDIAADVTTINNTVTNIYNNQISWEDLLTAAVAASESIGVTSVDDDLAGLLSLFRTMANDLAIGNFTTPEAKRFIILGKQDTEKAAKCHKDTVTISAISGRIRRVALAPTAGGTGYALNDTLTVTTGGTGGTVEIVGVSGGVVTAVRLVSAGSGYTTGTGKATTGGSGTGCTVRIVELCPNLAASTHTYDASPIFEPSEVSLGEPLEKVTLEKIGVTLEGWNNTATGIPTRFMPLTGGSVRIWPTPAASALTQIGAVAITAAGTGYAVGNELTVGGAGTGGVLVVTAVSSGGVTAVQIKPKDADGSYRGTGYALASGIATTTTGAGTGCTVQITELAALRIHGYAIKEHDLLADADIPLTVPKGYRISAILARALQLACIARRATGNNLTASQKFHDEWGIECEKIRNSVTGDGR